MVWLTLEQMSELFNTTKRNIEMHIKNVYEEGELEENSTWKEQKLEFRQIEF